MIEVLKARLPMLASALVLVLGLGAWWQASLGFRSFTWESYRRLQVAEHPRVMPRLTLEDQHGRVFDSGLLRGQVLVVNFIYSRCTSLCILSGTHFGRLLTAIHQGQREGRVHLVSISLDPDYDRPSQLLAYQQRYRPSPVPSWSVVRVNDRQALRGLLSDFGVVSIADGFGGIKHNAAAHIVDARGRLVAILDEDDETAILAEVDRLLAEGEGQ